MLDDFKNLTTKYRSFDDIFFNLIDIPGFFVKNQRILG
jgi:hypothetical protein